MERLKVEYQNKIVPALTKQLNMKSRMQVPRIEKIILSMCMKDATTNPKLLNAAAEELTAIAAQRAVITKAKKSISNFKLREGMPIGARATLRGDRMWTFLERLINIAIPRVRDFRGLPTRGFDGHGNYNMGLKEQIVFPEVNFEKVEKVQGMNITFCTNAESDAHGRALLEALGLPFRKN